MRQNKNPVEGYCRFEKFLSVSGVKDRSHLGKMVLGFGGSSVREMQDSYPFNGLGRVGG